jgi:hypothetical protein
MPGSDPRRRTRKRAGERTYLVEPGEPRKYLFVAMTAREHLAVKTYCLEHQIPITSFARTLIFDTIGPKALHDAQALLHRQRRAAPVAEPVAAAVDPDTEF